ncbi:HRDC domain-containing protein [Mobiluncus curtisii]|uniref:HRDC domain-containing protein n=1 Tax=Mobiluncus curtisii TaxID=2051 RepID=UPI00201660A0|nr:HRDC domain-containing protein [Mobiluncus curtisii]
MSSTTSMSQVSTPRLVTRTREPLAPIVNTSAALARVCELVADATGPVALDTERAGSFRYSQGAYLVQLRREGAGTFLIDPIAFPDLEPLSRAIGKAEWILHDATQDLPYLLELGMRPQLLFDTELAAKLLNFQGFGLAAVLEQVLGISLAKEHSAADWSTRPLPSDWQTYAALDVDYLIDLRNHLWLQLQDADKDDWAEQEFDFLLDFQPPAPKPDPWRHVPGSGKVHAPRNLAALRELWYSRDDLAQQEDLAPTKVLTNAAMIALAVGLPKGKRYMAALEDFRHDRTGRKRADRWFAALRRSYQLSPQELPPRRAPRIPGDVPDSRSFTHNHPQEADRWRRLRESVAGVAAQLDVNHEAMLEPKTIRRLAWMLPDDATKSQVLEVLQASQARPWQIENTLDSLVQALKSEK